MASSKQREREYERRRYMKWMMRASQVQQRRRRNRLIALVSIAALVVGVGAWWFLRPDPDLAPVSDIAGATSAPTTPAATAPDPALAQNRLWAGSLALSQGAVGIELDGVNAPQAVANFVQLSSEGFYNGLSCHRLASSIYVLQCGDPAGDGSGGPGYSFGPIENAPADDIYPAGTIAMARVGGDGNSMGSQFFITYGDAQIPSDTAGGYTVMGHVTSGLDIITQIAAAGTVAGTETPTQSVVINQVEIQ